MYTKYLFAGYYISKFNDKMNELSEKKNTKTFIACLVGFALFCLAPVIASSTLIHYGFRFYALVGLTIYGVWVVISILKMLNDIANHRKID
jgi:hypothetical protein